MVKVKICGITNPQDALMAAGLGVDMLGFIFASSPRQVTPRQARDIIHALPPFVKTVGVFVDEEIKSMQDIMNFCGLDLIQLHGNEPPHVCKEFMPHTIKAFRIKDELSLQAIKPYHGKVKALLLDTYSEEKKGGTGKTFDWDLSVRNRGMEVPIILSGGLRPSNIQRAISTVQPYAVDVNSGIEECPGKKEPLLMKELMEKIKQINSGGYLDD